MPALLVMALRATEINAATALCPLPLLAIKLPDAWGMLLLAYNAHPNLPQLVLGGGRKGADYMQENIVFPESIHYVYSARNGTKSCPYHL